jgi:voltage-gated potassium channel
MHNEDNALNNKATTFDLLVIVLSVYVLGAMLVDIVFHLPPEISRILGLVDNGICIFFLGEFCIRFYKAESKLQFLKWGWIDLLSSIPTVDYLRAGRAFRLIRLIRVLRAFRSTKHLVNYVFKNKQQGTFTTASLLAVLLIIFSSIAILQVEDVPDSNIKSAEDALWWSYVTITTVGYGDRFPVTTEGRIIAAILMTAGVGLFGVFTGFIASWFVVDKKGNDDPES